MYKTDGKNIPQYRTGRVRRNLPITTMPVVYEVLIITPQTIID